MERLTYRDKKGKAHIFCKQMCADANEDCTTEHDVDICQRYVAFDKLAAYEDAEEQGLILLLPISKDTPVYSIEYCCGRGKNNQIGMCVRGFCKDCDDKAYFIRESTAEYCNICEIQKSVFFTSEAAEAKLKEMEGRHE